MNRVVLGALAALLLVGAGIFWWQGRAETERGADLPPAPPSAATGEALPGENGAGQRGAAPPEVDEVTREQRRFDRLDRNRDSRVDRNEMLGPRVAGFRKLDADHNNLLSFEEWAVKTSDRFRASDANRNGSLDRAEFATTKPKPSAKPKCACTPARRGSRSAPRTTPEPELDDEGSEPAD